jgi:hypothetical protein
MLFAVSFTVFAQKDSDYYSKSDSLKNLITRDLTPPVTIIPQYFIPLRALNTFPSNLQIGIHSYENIYDNSYELPTNLLFPVQFQSHDNLKYIYTILGIAQIGTVSYLAYKHIQKYGFIR